MPLLAGLLVNLFAGVAGFFAQWLTKKTALAAAAVAVFATLTVTLYTAVGAMLTAVAVAVPADSALLMGMWVAFPDNVQPLIALAIATDTSIALYRWNVENLRLMAYVT